MKTFTRAALLVSAAVVVIGSAAACAPEPRTSSLPSATLTSTPMPSGAALPVEADLTAWAEGILPENAPGGPGVVLRTVGTLRDGTPEQADVSQIEGLWELAVGCESSDGTPTSINMVQDGATIFTSEVACFSADDAASGGEGPAGGVMRIAFDGGHSTQVLLAAAGDAVFVLQVYPGTPAAN